MSFVGALLVLAGGGATAWLVGAIAGRRRPIDLLAAVAAPIAFVLALIGGVLLFVPRFLG